MRLAGKLNICSHLFLAVEFPVFACPGSVDSVKAVLVFAPTGVRATLWESVGGIAVDVGNMRSCRATSARRDASMHAVCSYCVCVSPHSRLQDCGAIKFCSR